MTRFGSRRFAACAGAGATALLLGLAATPARAQSNDRPIEVQGFVHGGMTQFTAKDSFEAIFGEAGGEIVGGGGQVTLNRGFLRGLFFAVSRERFKDTGQRVFVFNGEVFPLGLAERATITPLLFTVGYKFGRLWNRVTPYAGGGAGKYRLEIDSEFADPSENVDESFTGYHVLGGAEVRIWRFISGGAEVRWATVADALTGGVATEFREDNLGGTTAVAKLLVGW